MLALGDRTAVVRFTKVIDPSTPLLKGWIQALRNKEEIYPFSDMVMAPMPLFSAVDALCHVARKRYPGIFQISGRRDITYEQVARYLAESLGAEPGCIQPKRAIEGGLPLAAIPAYTTLDTTRLCLDGGVEIPGVWRTIDLVLGI